MEKHCFYSLNFENDDFSKSFKLCSLWDGTNDAKVIIMVVCDYRVFTGVYNEESLRKFANEADISFEEYLECMRYSFGSKAGPKNDEISFSDGELIWQRVFKDFVVLFGNFQLPLLDNGGGFGLLIHSILCRCQSLEEQVCDLTTENVGLRSSLDEIQGHSEQLVNEKLDMENTLYAKFLHILNEKREIIARLQEDE